MPTAIEFRDVSLKTPEGRALLDHVNLSLEDGTTTAVLGRSFGLWDAAAMLGETPAALLTCVEEAVAARVLVADDNRINRRLLVTMLGQVPDDLTSAG